MTCMYVHVEREEDGQLTHQSVLQMRAKCCEYSEQFDYMFVPDKGWSFKYSRSCN